MLKTLFILLLSFNFAYSCALCGNGKASFVTVAMNAYFAEDKIEKIHTQWKFDSGTSKDFKQLYSEKILASDKKRMYDGLENFQVPYFMTSIIINGKNISFKAENFDLSFDHNIVTIEFDIPLNYNLNDKNSVEIIFVDSTKAIVFLENLDNLDINNSTNYTIKKLNGFKVIKELVATVNYIKLEISK
ncbi:hypothetical protein SJPD1_1944 [Sulfurospirillum diekertiae]|uniref:Periplasmic protein n=1 Tax=Sulfurospirillum diekertiae TaxID=1854492 RepID=A0A290HXF0_9BACT|nr:DUF1007 family protein [Sulfurospirillum diekertiae]ATB70049.1 hypothetical protein SJPD1_1944 [Sulfurospirillum diekertiae]